MNEEEDAREANKSVTESMFDFMKRKEAAKIHNQQVFKEMKKNPQPPIQPPINTSTVKPVTASKEPLSPLRKFEEKLVKDFGLTVKIDKYEWHQLFYKEFKVFELVPRKGFRFGVYREDPEQNNKWKCFRVETDEDETRHYAFAKEFIELNSQ